MSLDLVKDIMYKWSTFLFFTNENHIQHWESYSTLDSTLYRHRRIKSKLCPKDIIVYQLT